MPQTVPDAFHGVGKRVMSLKPTGSRQHATHTPYSRGPLQKRQSTITRRKRRKNAEGMYGDNVIRVDRKRPYLAVYHVMHRSAFVDSTEELRLGKTLTGQEIGTAPPITHGHSFGGTDRWDECVYPCPDNSGDFSGAAFQSVLALEQSAVSWTTRLIKKDLKFLFLLLLLSCSWKNG